MSAPELREPPVQPVSADAPPLVPARMVNEYVYCPRLAYLEWVQGEWVESSDTVEGRHAHRRVNREGGKLPPPATWRRRRSCTRGRSRCPRTAWV